MQQPTVGRIVHVLVDPKHNNGADVAPAIITRAWGPEAVNVRVLHDGPNVVDTTHNQREEWMTSISVHESREALEDHAAQRQAELDAISPGQTVAIRGAFWPPRD